MRSDPSPVLTPASGSTRLLAPFSRAFCSALALGMVATACGSDERPAARPGGSRVPADGVAADGAGANPGGLDDGERPTVTSEQNAGDGEPTVVTVVDEDGNPTDIVIEGTGVTFDDFDPEANDGPPEVDEDDACALASAEATLITEPVDIIVLLDNSGSMRHEIESVEANINVNFAQILENAEIDYRLILIARHRTADRDDPDVKEALTSICVTAPLSNLAACPAPEPVFSDRFFHYSTKIESDDSFDIALDTYELPFEDNDLEDKYDNAPLGWSEWARPGLKKVFLEVSDDVEDMPIETFIAELTAMAPEHFGTVQNPTFKFHSIVGVGEKAGDPAGAYLPDEPVQTVKCNGNGNDVTSAGISYQELSRRTGGLRFPLCQFQAYDVVFQTIAEDVVQSSRIACDFAIPEPPVGEVLDLERIAVAYQPGAGGDEQRFGQALTSADCQAGAFYVDGGRIHLCPDACATVQADAFADVNVLFTCESTVIIR